MKSKFSQISKSRVKLTIEVPAEKFQRFFEIALERKGKGVALPGFRPGKAPRKMLIEAIGEGPLLEEGLNLAINDSYPQAIKEHELRPVGQPAITIVQYPSLEEKDKSLLYSLETDTLPEVKIKNYRTLKLEKEDEGKLEVTEEEVEKVVKYLQNQGATFEPKIGHIEKGDRAEIDFEGFVDQVKKDALSSSNFPLIVGESNFLPGFEDQLLGMSQGENKEFKIVLPKEFPQKDLVGKTVTFKVEAKLVQKIILPPADDKFAENFGFQTVGELKNKLKENLALEKKERARQEKEKQLAEFLIGVTEAEIPQSLLELESQRLRTEIETNIAKNNMKLEDYLAKIHIPPEKFAEDIEKEARKNLLVGLALGEIAKREKIRLDKERGMRPVVDWLIQQATKQT